MLDSFLQALTNYESVISALVGMISLCIAAWGAIRLTGALHRRVRADQDSTGSAASTANERVWPSLFSLGVSEHSQLEELVSVRIVNVALIGLMALSFPWIVIDLLLDKAPSLITLVVLVVFIGSLLGLGLQRAGAASLARWLVIFMASAYWLGVLLAVGPMQGTEYFVAGLVTLPVLMLSRVLVIQRLMSIVVIGSVFALGVTLSSGQAAQSGLSEEMLTLRYYANAVVLALLIVLSVSYYKRFAANSYELLSSKKQEHDALVSRLIPAELAQKIKDKVTFDATWHAEGTVIVIKLSGFSDLYAKLPAIEIVKLLDELYSQFDELLSTNKVEKVKTLGTTYVAAAGLDSNSDINLSVARCALAMRDIVGMFSNEHRVPVGCRCAIATGLTISGVIGKAQPRFDIWGAALDEATTLVSDLETGEIAVNDTAYWRFKPFFDFTSVGSDTKTYQLMKERTADVHAP